MKTFITDWTIIILSSLCGICISDCHFPLVFVFQNVIPYLVFVFQSVIPFWYLYFRVSFPSGHSSVSFYTMVWLMVSVQV